jgi:hydroxypyruvate reductase
MIAERHLLRQMFDAAVASAQPLRLIPRHLPPLPRGRTIVVGAGKATAAMARALDDAWPAALTGIVVTRYGHAVPCKRIEVVEAAHPVPDEAGIAAAGRVLAAVRGLTADDLVICLISGGGSALLPLPLPGIALADKQSVARALLASGAPISDINCVRRHLSAIKGGRLAAACHPARVVTLAISDVPGDDPIDIASGPTVADPTTREDAVAVLARYRITAPPAIAETLRDAAAESVKPGDPRLASASYHVIATPQMALEAAAGVARGEGVAPLILADSLEGEARDVGKMLAAIARQVAMHGQPSAPPCVLLSGGETTVTVRGAGRGAGATWNACSRLRSRCKDSRTCTRWPATPTASTVRRRSPAAHHHARYARARPRARPSRRHDARRQRRAYVLRGARRCARHRADAHERQRFPRGADYGASNSSRHRPSTFCTGRSEKLKSTASSTAVWCTAVHAGTTKMSLGPQSNVSPPTTLRPRPSTTVNTVPSVARYGWPAKPAGSSWMKAAIVGIG